MALQYPHIDPVAISFGKFGIRWYSLAYAVGIIAGWWIFIREHAKKPIPNLSQKAADDTMVWVALGIVLGGRLGFVLFYKPAYYLQNPLHAFALWEGGMSFHGGCLGVIIAFVIFCRIHKIRFLHLMDVAACVVPIGLCLGRLANFINGELWGRVTDAPWGMVFPTGGDLPRHPSQLYEAFTEGVVLFAVLMFLLKCTNARDRAGLLSGVFLVGYWLARSFCELFREPDSYLGFFWGGITMGQLLSLPMLVVGAFLIIRALRKPAAP